MPQKLLPLPSMPQKFYKFLQCHRQFDLSLQCHFRHNFVKRVLTELGKNHFALGPTCQWPPLPLLVFSPLLAVSTSSCAARAELGHRCRRPHGRRRRVLPGLGAVLVLPAPAPCSPGAAATYPTPAPSRWGGARPPPPRACLSSSAAAAAGAPELGRRRRRRAGAGPPQA